MFVSVGTRARLPLTVALAASLLLSAGCSRIRDHKGYVADQALIASIQPGIDNRESVERTLGRPTFVAEFDKNIWYYVSRETQQLAFSKPKAQKQTVLAVNFDPKGNVVAVQKTGLEKIAAISPDSDRTPTLGREHGFFKELFGNIGQVGSAGGAAGGTTDNPN